MTRLEKARGIYKNDIVYTVWKNDVKTFDCCPYFLDCGEDDLDTLSKVGDYGSIQGCRGITCEQCWNKEVSND